MYQYPKAILSIPQLVQKMQNYGMIISSVPDAENIISRIGYFRLRGYCFHFFDHTTQQYLPGTNFSAVYELYKFDFELSHLLFDFITKIEVSLRARLVDSLLIHNDALILNDPSYFDDKELYWKNMSAISSEIARSNDVFVKHNFDKHDGVIPVWAVAEILSFGTLSKLIKTLKIGAGSSLSKLVNHYRYMSPNQKLVAPSKQMFTSWIQSVSILRNICAHNGRVYNRTITTMPELVLQDVQNPRPKSGGLYQVVMAMKYLRPSDEDWNEFKVAVNATFSKYKSVVDLARLNFPTDWANHFQI